MYPLYSSAIQKTFFNESLIIAQDERWLCALGMQVERSFEISEASADDFSFWIVANG